MRNRVLNAYDWFLIAGIIVSNIVYSILSKNLDIIGTITAVSGVVCVVLVAKGNIWNYLFGLINVSLYAYVSFKATAYGDAALNALYYLPMQFIGYFAWRKRVDSEIVKARRLTRYQRLWVALGCVVLIIALGFILQRFGDGQPFKDPEHPLLHKGQCHQGLCYNT